MDILVFGAGNLGSLVGGLLARVHDVTLVGRDPHISAIQAHGLTVTGAAEAETNPDAATSIPPSMDGTDAADLAIVTVKTYDTATAAHALSTGEYGAVCSLQNGLTESIIAEQLGSHSGAGTGTGTNSDSGPVILAGTATYGARLEEPGVVECTGLGTVTIGLHGGGTHPWAEGAGEAFESAGIITTVASDMPYRRWEKLAINAGINAPTALARVTNGALVDGPASELSRTAARETAALARAVGVHLSDDHAVDAVESVAEATAPNHSSMRQDVETGNRTEIDAINGEIVNRAADHGIDVPVNVTLTALIRAWEAERDLR